MRILTLGLVAGLAALASHADAAQAQPVTTCEAEGPARPVCTFTNPEDLVALPGDEAILVSEYGGMEGHVPGALALLVLETDERRELFRGGDDDGAATPGWGDPACPGPLTAAFSPHGIHLSTRADGALQLLAVQHGGRESVEYFEVTGSGRDWAVEWRGCVVAPDDAWLNSVAALPGGGFVATNFQRDEGELWEWQPGAGWSEVPGSETAGPNGIEASPDGEWLYIGGWGTQSLIRLSRGQTPVVVDSVEVGFHVDNVHWAPDGTLLAAGHAGSGPDSIFACIRQGTCDGVTSRVAKIIPNSLAREEIVRYPSNDRIILGTVGIQVGDEIWVGGVGGGERIGRFPAP
jgi:hypothetical protein